MDNIVERIFRRVTLWCNTVAMRQDVQNMLPFLTESREKDRLSCAMFYVVNDLSSAHDRFKENETGIPAVKMSGGFKGQWSSPRSEMMVSSCSAGHVM